MEISRNENTAMVEFRCLLQVYKALQGCSFESMISTYFNFIDTRTVQDITLLKNNNCDI